MTFPKFMMNVKTYLWALPLAIIPMVAGTDNDQQQKSEKQQLFFNHIAMTQTQLLTYATQPVSIAKLTTQQPVAPLNIDSVVNVMTRSLDFSQPQKDSLTAGIKDYQHSDGYKYFDTASRYVLSDLNVANRTFVDLDPANKVLLTQAKIIDPKNNVIIKPVYEKLPSAEQMAATGQEKLHRVNWQTALNFAAVGYLGNLAEAAQSGTVYDYPTWQAWNHQQKQDKSYIPGAGGRVVELGAFMEQHFGAWAEEHQQLRGGVNEGRHTRFSEHYSAKFVQRHTDFSQAIDVFAPGRTYGKKQTHLLDSIYQHHILPYRDILGVPRVLNDSVRSRTENNKFVNPGLAVWEMRGHYGDHVHISATRQCATLYAGNDAVAAQDAKRDAIMAIFKGNRILPVAPYKKEILDDYRNMIVITRDSVVAQDPAYAWQSDVQKIKEARKPKLQKKYYAHKKPHNRSHARKLAVN